MKLCDEAFSKIINRPGVAIRPWELKLLVKVHLFQPVMCHMSCVARHMSHNRCHMSKKLKIDKLVELAGPTTSSLIQE